MATGELRWLEEANRLARLAVELFADDERGGFFLSPADGEELVARKKDLEDHPTPSGNSMLASVLLRLARIYGDDELERRAVGVFRLVHGAVTRAPSAFGHALTALDLHFSPPRELAIVGPVDAPVARAALEPFQPNTVVAVGPSDEVPLLAGKTPRRRPTGGLRLRALRVPGAGHRRGRALVVRNVHRLFTKTSRHGGTLPAMAASTRWIVLAALAAGLTAVAALSGSADGRVEVLVGRPPQRPRPHDRRPDGRVDARHAEREDADRRPGRHVRQQLRLVLALLPVALDLPHRPVRAQPRRLGQHGAERRLLQARLDEHAARLAPARRLPDHPPRQVPEPVRDAEPARDPAGLGPVVRHARSVHLSLPELPDQREREPRPVRQRRRRLQDRRRVAARGRPHLAPGRRSAPVLHVGRLPRAA